MERVDPVDTVVISVEAAAGDAGAVVQSNVDFVNALRHEMFHLAEIPRDAVRSRPRSRANPRRPPPVAKKPSSEA